MTSHDTGCCCAACVEPKARAAEREFRREHGAHARELPLEAFPQALGEMHLAPSVRWRWLVCACGARLPVLGEAGRV